MQQVQLNKKKIINDPVFGFINLQSDIIFDLLEHPIFQRLRYIKQLGLSYLVFPGANHTRFEHAIGTVHLMRQAITVLKIKGHEITDEEAEAVSIAILLHDIGHAPFSHVLENTLVNISHEEISLMLMQELNQQFNGKLDLAIKVFTNKYRKQFLHQLVASQLDMDRLDYLSRDSFFTGVVEGTIGIDRIIKMLNVHNDQLVVDVKGIYSIEKFLISRRLMYWQVYLHKTVVAAEFLLINVLKRAREIITNGGELFVTPTLKVFLTNNFTPEDFRSNIKIQERNVLQWYTLLDDNDILISIKEWQNHPDPVLSEMAKSITNRKLPRTKFSDKPISTAKELKYLKQIEKQLVPDPDLAKYFLMTGVITNNAYNKHYENISVLYKDGTVKEINDASDINLSALGKTVKKYFVCYPKELDIY
ncbi:HD domain-containing protein [Draconibacterium sediminis]|uniref:Phosphohydrolase n=1 Tax=Draconibacterium sediminis TaxID=1544798 RepID=A0A0D8J9G9_9BACT|nr:HD domain-containing protein [Draconibacterium sediminis]KJF43171.1 phosphohydrolase [Draconibacterium sediminis]